ncbi:MAG TPA: BadF/BadG/BcrA/BcrD ATPase family protein [Candidatus Limnocylindrales bacterium]|jgi:N-acetylglucosamine kinase-like BadF-type ATPase
MTAADLVLLGVDGGNTKTIAVAAAPDGTVLGTGRVVRGSDIHAVPVDAALGVYDEATSLALAEVAVDRSQVVAAFSLAGADWPEDVALLTNRLAERWPRASVVNDAIGALRAAIPSGPGVVVVAGTGTATGARGADGRTWHSGFWQEVQGARELGVRAVQAVVRAELGIDPPTALTDAVLRVTGERDIEALLHHASGRDVVDRRDPAVLAPALLASADAGDRTAIEIVDRHGTALGRMAVAAARRVGLRPSDAFSLALTGGVLRQHPGRLRAAIIAAVSAEAPRVVVVEPAQEPVAGALLLAFDTAGIPVDTPVVERIEDGLRSAATGWYAP